MAASRVVHEAGRTVEVDWSGPTMQLTDPVTGGQTTVYLFVGCLPFSRYGFVEPTVDMRQDTWLRAPWPCSTGSGAACHGSCLIMRRGA
jgi:transposase